MTFFRTLLLGADGIGEVLIGPPDLEPITMLWIPSGLTAGVAVWTRHREALAASVLRSGLDRLDDGRAMAILMNSPSFPCSADAWSLVARSGTPLLANLYHDAAAASDTTIASASTALAATFFGLLGVDSDEEADGVGADETDEPRPRDEEE